MFDEIQALNEFEDRTCGISNRSTELFVSSNHVDTLRKHFPQFTFTETSTYDNGGNVLVKVSGNC